MGNYNYQEVKAIIFEQPNKGIVGKAQAMRKLYSKHTHSIGYKDSIKRDDYVEDDPCYQSRKSTAISNRDLFKRLLNREDQIFTTTGGSATFQLPDSEEKQMNGLIDDVIHGMNIYKWVETYALPAYRADPMGLIFMEAEEVRSFDGVNFPTPKCYPTYKSSDELWDYLPNGRKLEYVCFTLSKEQLKAYGLIENVPNLPSFAVGEQTTQYYRFVDDTTDTIYKRDNDTLTVVNMRQKNPMPHNFGRVPAFIISDLFQYDDPKAFGSPLQFVIEIAESFLHDRSVRDLHKKLHGFPKAVEPLLTCTTCSVQGQSTGLVRGNPCPDCTLPGQSQGTGFKLRTTPADVARFPLEMLKDIPRFKASDIFMYITPDVKGLDAMNIGLVDQEELISCTYWGTKPVRVQGFNGKQDINETATKTLTDLQPIYSRLNCAANWAENAIKDIADFIGIFWFKDLWKGANISLSRNYILELPEDILIVYEDMLSKGVATEAELSAQFKKYLSALYKSNPDKMAIQIKFFELQPFPHVKNTEVEASPVIPLADKIASRYYGEWVNSLTELQKRNLQKDKLKALFDTYVKDKVTAVTKEQKAQADAEAKLKNAGKPQPKGKVKSKAA